MTAAIVGCGSVAGGLDEDPKKRHIYTHANAVGRVSGLSLRACCDNDEVRARAFARRWDLSSYYSDLEQMLGEEPIDVLIVATPTRCHYEHVKIALASDVRVVFCEKPLTFDLGQSKELVGKAQEADKLLLVNYMRRWDNFYEECRTRLVSGQLGRIETIVAYVDTALYMNASHMLDMLVYLAGNVGSCVGHVDRENPARVVHGEKDPGAIALISHQSGVLSFIKATGRSRERHFFELDIQCTDGRLRILDDDAKYEVYRFMPSPQHSGLWELTLTETVVNDRDDERLVNAYQDILEFLKHGRVPRYLASESLKSLELIGLIHQSDRNEHRQAYSEL